MSGQTTFIERDVGWAKLDVKSWAPRRDGRRIYRVTALSAPLAYGVHNNNLVNLMRGIRERVFAVEQGGVLVQPPRPEPGIFDAELATEAALLDRQAFGTTPYTTTEFVDTYVGRRRTVYEKAVESLAALPVHRGDADSKSFLKAEKINFSSKGDPAPRLIHPRDPRYNVSVGQYLKKVEHSVYYAIDGMWGHRTVLKGYNAARVAGILRQKWDSFTDPVAIGLDASRFDQHVSEDALKWEHSRYLPYYVGKDRETLRELLRWQLRTKCLARADNGRVKYVVNGMRFSGDMNTGLGNCLLMSSMVRAWCRKRGIRASLGNNGDDCVLVLDRSQVDQLDLTGMCRWFVTLGFTMKVEPTVDVFERIEFCQAHPVWNGSNWVMCRNHRVAQAKDCVSIKPLDNKSVFDRWRRSVGLCGLSLTGGIPVQQEFYEAFARGTEKVEALTDPTLETGMAILARGMSEQYREPTPLARYSYWLAFGVTPDEQEAIEGFYRDRDLVYSRPIPGLGTYTCPNELSL